MLYERDTRLALSAEFPPFALLGLARDSDGGGAGNAHDSAATEGYLSTMRRTFLLETRSQVLSIDGVQCAHVSFCLCAVRAACGWSTKGAPPDASPQWRVCAMHAATFACVAWALHATPLKNNSSLGRNDGALRMYTHMRLPPIEPVVRIGFLMQIGNMEWSATGRAGASLAEFSNAQQHVAHSFRRAASRLEEMRSSRYWRRQRRDVRGGFVSDFDGDEAAATM